jgi:hypothetical protein
MQELDQYTITDVALAQMSSTKDERLHEIMDAAVRHLHEFAREVDLKPHELFEGLRFLTGRNSYCFPRCLALKQS